MDIVAFEDLKRGDRIMIEGTKPDQILIIKIEKIIKKDCLIIPKGMGGIDVALEDLEHIVRLNKNDYIQELISNP